MTQDDYQLSQRQVDLLIKARDLDEPVVIDAETLETLRGVLEPAVEASGVRDPTALSVGQLARQLDPAADDSETETLVQNPETTRPSSDDLDDEPDEPATVTDALEQANTETRQEAKLLLSKAGVHDRNDRLPAHATELRRQAARHLDVPVDDLEAALDHGEIDVPSDPKLLLE